MSTRRIALEDVVLEGAGVLLTLPCATLLLTQRWMPDGLGGGRPGRTAWTIAVPDGLPVELFVAPSSARLSFRCGAYGGTCFAESSTTLRGNGPYTRAAQS